MHAIFDGPKLLKTAQELLAYQQADGSIELSWTNPPVGAGAVHGTFQAAQTWRQAGWDFTTITQTSNAFATGQTLYTLRTLGRSDSDPAVAKGTKWLLDHQADDGGWSHAGFGKAEAMWGVLGLVSVDVLSVAVTGGMDGQHADGTLTIVGAAKDNQGGGVAKIEITIDDVLVHGTCGATVSYAWNTDGLEIGKHLIDVTATNAGGLTSRRRIEVFTGAYYLTQIGVSSTRAGIEGREQAGQGLHDPVT